MYHFDNGKIYNCLKCRHVAFVPGCIFHKDYKPSENNYPCDMHGNSFFQTGYDRGEETKRIIERIKNARKEK